MKNVKRLILMMMLAAPLSAEAQWKQTSGPEGGWIRTAATSGSTTLATTAYGRLFRRQGEEWVELARLTPRKLFATGGGFFALLDTAILRSTDRGDTWEPVGPTGRFLELEVDGSTLYAVADDTVMSRSTDAGTTWLPIPTPAISSPIMAMTARDSLLIAGGGYASEAFTLRSTDGGGTWNKIERTGLPNDGLIESFHSTPTALYAIYFQKGIYRSTDGGITWGAINAGLPGLMENYPYFSSLVEVGERLWTASADAVYLYEEGVWHEQEPEQGAFFTLGDGVLYRGSFSGLARSTDGGKSWSPMNNGLRASLVTAFGLLDRTIFASGGDAIFKSTDGGEHWTGVTRLNVDQFLTQDTSIFARGKSYTDVGMLRSDDGGLTWNPITTGITEPLERLNAMAANSHTLFAGFYGRYTFGQQGQWETGGIFRSTDGGNHWSAASQGLPSDGSAYVPVVGLLAVGDVVLATTREGLYRSTDDGKSWTKVDVDPERDSVMVEYLAEDNGLIYMSALDRIYVSTDEGANWNESGAGIPAQSYVSGISMVAGNPYATVNTIGAADRIYGLDRGSWHDITERFPEGAGFIRFFAYDGKVLAGTLDRGVWMAPIGGMASVDEEPSIATGMSHPNPFTAGTTIEFTMRKHGHATLRLANSAGVVVMTAFDGMLDAGVHAVRISGSDLPAGAYFYRLLVDGEATAAGEIVKR